MPSKYDTLTSSSSDEETDERGGLSAQALHGTVAHHVSLENVVSAPPQYERPPIVPLPHFEEISGTLFDRSKAEAAKSKAEADEDDEETEEESTAPVASAKQPAPAPAPKVEHVTAEERPVAEAPAERVDDELVTPEDLAPTQPPEAAAFVPSEYDRPVHAEVESSAADLPEHTSEPQQRVEPTVPTPHAEYFAWPPAESDRPEPRPTVTPMSSQYTAPQPPIAPPRPAEHLDTPPPPPPASYGSHPPLPPQPPDGGYPSHGSPMPERSFPSEGYGSYNQAPAAPGMQYNQVPQPPENRRGIDTAARWGAFGNFLYTRSVSKRHGKEIKKNRQEAETNFADIQARQQRFDERQRQQGHAIEQLQAAPTPPLAERPVAPAPPFAPVSAEQTPLTAVRSEYVPLTVASQANPNIPTQRYAERPLQPLPPIEQSKAGQVMAEQASPEMPDQEAGLGPDQHRVQTHWYEAVVDKHGKVVEGAKEYGPGFQQHRREVVRDRAGDAAAAGTAALAGFGQQAPGQAPYPGSLPSGMTAPGLPQGMPTHADAQHRLPTQTPKTSVLPGPVFWVMLLVILAAFFAAALI